MAQRLILAGKVMIGQQRVLKSSQKAAPDEHVTVLEGPKYVSRGGFKLEKAIDSFAVSVTNKVVLDVGASTGGFTDVLLQHGARRVYAVDVGYGQLAWKLRNDPRVALLERVNARGITSEMFVDPIDLAVMDVSFIGARLILEPLARITHEVLLLFKPQFEAGPQDVPKGGVIRDAGVHRRVLTEFTGSLQPWHVHGMIDSPILGGDGNREFLLHLKTIPGWPREQVQQKIEELLP